jgi:methionine-R-sulfoxide reductase
MDWTSWAMGGVTAAAILCGCVYAALPGATNDLKPGKVSVKVFNDRGELVGPVETNTVVRTEDEWRSRLTPEQFQISREAGTERPGSCGLLHNKVPGVYSCVACNLPLFYAQTKFESGTGWPSFVGPIAPTNVIEKADYSYGMVRTEVNCARCGGHLGHVFDDGPPPTNKRYCMNGVALNFTPDTDLAKLADPAARSATTQPAK